MELSDIYLNCFIFSSTTKVTKCGKNFDFPTYIYGHQINEYDVKLLKEVYPNEGTDYVIWGEIKDNLFQQLLDCFKNSKSVKRKYKRLLFGN